MVLSQRGGVGRKPTGGIYKQARGKRRFEMGREPAHTGIGAKDKLKHISAKGDNLKVRVVEAHLINLFNPKEKKFQKVEVKTVAENTANRHFVRRNIITKGAIVTTDLGKARITSRPGQDGTVNAILL